MNLWLTLIGFSLTVAGTLDYKSTVHAISKDKRGKCFPFFWLFAGVISLLTGSPGVQPARGGFLLILGVLILLAGLGIFHQF